MIDVYSEYVDQQSGLEMNEWMNYNENDDAGYYGLFWIFGWSRGRRKRGKSFISLPEEFDGNTKLPLG